METKNLSASSERSNDEIKKIIQQKLNSYNLQLLKNCERQENHDKNLSDKIIRAKRVLNELNKIPNNVILELIVSEFSSTLVDLKAFEKSENFHNQAV